MKIFVFGHFDKGNFGDDFLEQKIKELFSEHDVTTFTDVCNKKYSDADVIIIGPGSVINNNFWAFENLNKLKAFNGPIIFFNVNLNNSFVGSKIQQELETLKNTKWYVRDKYSFDILKGQNVQYLPDLMFKDILEINGEKQRVLSVFPNAYLWNDLFSPITSKYLLAHNNLMIVSNYLNWMIDFDWHINIVPSQISKFIDDRIVGGNMYSLIKNKNYCTWYSDIEYPDIIKIIQESGLVLSMRYHSTACCIATKTPFVDITHDDKNYNLIRDAKLLSLSLPHEQVSHDALVSVTQRAENIESYLGPMIDYNNNAQKIWKNAQIV